MALEHSSSSPDAPQGNNGIAPSGKPRPTRWNAMRLRGLTLGRLSLQGKLMLAFSMLLLTALVAATGAFLTRGQSAVDGLMGEQARQLSQTLSYAAIPSYKLEDSEQLQRLCNDMLRGRNVVLVSFYGPTGNLLATKCWDPNYRALTAGSAPGTLSLTRVERRHLQSLGDFLQVTAPVLDRIPIAPGATSAEVHLLGYLTVGVAQNLAQSELHRIFVVAMSVGLGIFVLCLPLAIALVHRIFLPIRQLVIAAGRIARGQYDAHVQMQRPDEIGLLARSFNEMVDCIQRHRGQLEDANRVLEQKVRDRTAQLEATNSRLSAEIAEKEDFIRTVSHDLNAPLRNISGMATMLLNKYRGKMEEEVVHRLDRICRNVEMETDLISELLELSRIKTRRHRMEQVDLDEVVQGLVECFDADFRQRGISLIVENELPTLNCEKMRMRQVFQNLIDNAIKYMGDGPVREIRIGYTKAREGHEFFVTDTGLGIHRDDLSRVFYIFRRGRNSGDVQVAGKGVGLASVKSIIDTYGGRIWVESEPGRGSTFKFIVPPISPASPTRQENDPNEAAMAQTLLSV